MTMDLLLKALNASWTRETAYRTDQQDWTESRKEIGQCTVTSMIVFDYFGGKIVRGYSEKYDLFHYWNEINDEKIDLTFNQFADRRNDITFKRIVIKQKEELMKIRNVRHRYEILKKKLRVTLKTVDKPNVI